MPLSGFLIVLTAAVCHATWNVCIKRINGGPELIWLFSTISVILYLPLAIWIIVTQQPVFGLIEVLFVVGSVALHLGYFLLLQTGYRKGDLSLVYPIARATGPLLSGAFAVLFLGELITVQMTAGAIIVVCGVLMLSGGISSRGTKAPQSLVFGTSAGLLIGSYTAWDAFTVATLLVPPVLLDYASSVGRSVVLTPYARRNKRLVASHWTNHKASVLLVSVFNPLAYILVLYALTFTPVTYVAPTREIGVVLTVLAGSILLGEGHLKHRLIWASVIVAGTVMLVLG